jgi:transcriptional regulator with XRE-family HTH domain
MAARLGKACRDARLEAGLHAIAVAHAAGVSEATVSRFEAGGRWRRETDRIVAAYASECRLEVDDLWMRALNAKDPPQPKPRRV